MNPLLLLKANFAVNLEKQGSSLFELEEALGNLNVKESAEKATDLLKMAFLDKVNPIDIATKGATGYLGVAGTLGYLGASGIDTAMKSVDGKNKKLQTYKDKISLLDKLTKKINQEQN